MLNRVSVLRVMPAMLVFVILTMSDPVVIEVFFVEVIVLEVSMLMVVLVSIHTIFN